MLLVSFQRKETLAALSAPVVTLMDWPERDSGWAPGKLICMPDSNGPRVPARMVRLPFWKVARSMMKSWPWMRPATGESGMGLVVSRVSIQLVSLAGGATGGGFSTFWGGGVVAGLWPLPESPWAVPVGL